VSEKGQQQQRATQRLLVVANRLPVSAQRDGDIWDLKLSAGGLVSALLGMFLDCFLKHFGSFEARTGNGKKWLYDLKV
jgi:trehalose-6-phosphate synthase